MTRPHTTRRKRVNGVKSRQRILDAAAEIASERGYEGLIVLTVVNRRT
ncbi:hypothetical protein GCM10010228_03820 [Streptomyces massasporeus]|nr:hypothetical protein GCM10010228_03820 [Streptomyces massasporeus]